MPDHDPNGPLLVVTGVAKSYRGRAVLRDVDLRVQPGEAVAVVGENGAGKTTLLRICAGLLSPNAGQVATLGRVGYCPQEPGVMDLLTADEHMVLAGRGAGLSRAAGYRPAELVAGRLAFLTVLSLPILAGTATLMLAVSHPAHPAQLIAAVALLGLGGR